MPKNKKAKVKKFQKQTESEILEDNINFIDTEINRELFKDLDLPDFLLKGRK